MKIFLVGAELFHAGGRTDGRTGRQADGRAGGQHEANSHFS